MTDKTLNDLPKWAQALVLDEMIMGALRWPTEAEPAPVVKASDWGFGREADGKIVWSGHEAYGNLQATAYEVSGGYLFQPGKVAKLGGSRGNGVYYASEHDALLAAEWAYCRKVAAILLNARKARK